MKNFSAQQIDQFLDKIAGTREPDLKDRLLGMGLIGGSTAALELPAAHLLSKATARPEVSALEDSPETYQRAVREMQDNSAGTKNVVPQGADYAKKHLGGVDGAVYLDIPEHGPTILHGPDAKKHTLLHEMGHSTNRSAPSVRAINALNANRHTNALGLLTGLATGGTGNETLETLAPALVGAVHAPQLLEEGRAWLNADKALRSADAGSEIQNPFRRRGAGAMAGYGLAAGANMLGAYKLPAIIRALAEE